MPSLNQARLFEPFFQVVAHARHSAQGTGLGLAISQRFVQLMGGTITIQSTVGQGATFSFALPLVLAPAPETAVPPAIAQLVPDRTDFRLLVVDDDADSRQLLTELLTELGFAVRQASEGQQAIQIWRQWQPHLIWMDVRMPGMDGYEAIRHIRAEQSSTQAPVVIALTASAFEEERAAILQCGCDDCVRKPFQLQQIFDQLTQHLGVQFYPRPGTTATVADPEHTAARTLQAQDLQTMPHPWICRLHRAAVQVDAEQIQGLIDQIPPKHQALITQLRHLTQCYDFDTLIDLTEQLL